MTLKHIVTDLHQVYLTEMEAKIKPKSTAGTEKKSDSEGGTAEDQVKKAARQLAYDTRYKARRDGLPLERAFTQTLQNSSASGPVKELAKGMLFGGGQKEEVEKISEKPELPPEVYAALRRLENKRQRKGGDPKDSPFPSDRKKEVKKESIGTAIDKTLGAAGEVADTAVKFPAKAVGYAAGLKKGLKKQFKKGQSKANEETLHEISADKLTSAAKAAEVKRGKAAVAGDKETAKKAIAQNKKFYYAAKAKRQQEEVQQESSIGSAVDKTLGAAGEVADTALKAPVKAVGYVAGLKKGLKKQFKKGQSKANEEVSIEEAKKVKPASGKKAKKKDKVLVTPVKDQGKPYRRYADAKKKYELRKNPQISSVTGTSYGQTYDEKPQDKKNPGKFPQQKKAKKDFDGDGKLETSKQEWKGSRDKAIKKSIKKTKKEEFSNWKESFEFDLTEIINSGKKEATPKKIQELKGKNTIIINPKLEENIETLGGYVLGFDELNEQYTEESIDLAADFFVEEGINEDGLDLIIEEVGIEAFTEFVFENNTTLLDEAVRDMKKAPKRDYEKVKASVYKKDAERKSKGTGEYSKTKAAKDKYGDEDNTVHDDDAPAPKKKGGAIVKSQSSAIVKSAAKKAKEKQPEKKPEKKGLVGKIRGAVAKGMERHKAATKAASKSLKATAKQHSQHRKDFVKGATPTAKEKKIASGIGKAVKKAVTGEEVEHIDELKSTTLSNYISKAAADSAKKASHSGAVSMTDGPDSKRATKNRDKAWKRVSGIRRAGNKLASRAIRGGQEDSTKKFEWEEVQTVFNKKKAIDERLGGKGYSRAAMKSSIHPPSRQSSGDWEDSDRGSGNKAKRRAGEKVKAKSPTYIAYVKNKNQKEQLDPKKVEAGSAPADEKADSQIANKEKKVAIMKRQILQKKMQAVRSGATADITASYNPVDEAYRVLAKDKGDKGKPSQFSYKDEKDAKKFADSIKKGGGKSTVAKEGIDPRGGGDNPDLSPKQQDTERKQTSLEREKIAKKRRILQQMRQQAVAQGRQPSGHTAREEKEKGLDGKACWKGYKLDGTKKKGGKTVDNCVKVNEDELSELNRYEKEKGTDTKTGKPITKGGTAKDDKAFQFVAKKYASQRMGANQSKKVKGQKSTAGTGKYLKKAQDKKAYAAKAKKAGFKSTQAYTDTMARYGGEDNYKAGRGLGT